MAKFVSEFYSEFERLIPAQVNSLQKKQKILGHKNEPTQKYYFVGFQFCVPSFLVAACPPYDI